MIREKKKQKVDGVLLVSVSILILMGLMIIFSTSSIRFDKDPHYYLKAHLIRIVMGFCVLVFFSKLNYNSLRWMTPFFLIVALGLVVMVLFLPLPPDVKVNRWIIWRGRKIFQPSELMKITMVLYLAAVFAKGMEAKFVKGNALYGHFAFLLATVGLVFIEPDLGTALVIFFMGLSMFYLSGVSGDRLLKMTFAVVPLVLIGMIKFSYQRLRVTKFAESLFNEAELTHQVRQSIIGLAHGGLTGVGYGEGKQRFFFLPEPFSDFVLSSLGEEMGFIGVFIVFILLMIILWRGIRIALSAPDRYGFLLAGGLTAMILINALINAAVVVNLLPTTGLPFPFLSYGGSSLLVQMMGVGILLNISKHVKSKNAVSYPTLNNW